MSSWSADAEHGQVAGLEALAIGMLVLVVGTLVVSAAWAAVDARMVTSAAAREAARAYVEAPDAGTAATQALDAATAVIQGHGRDVDRFGLTRQGSFARCARVEFEATYEVPVVQLPWVGATGGWTVRARHSELVDPYRSGLEGTAHCGG